MIGGVKEKWIKKCRKLERRSNYRRGARNIAEAVLDGQQIQEPCVRMSDVVRT